MILERLHVNMVCTLSIAIFFILESCLPFCRYCLGYIMLMLDLDLVHLGFDFIRLLSRSYFLVYCKVGLILMFLGIFGRLMLLRSK